MIFFLNSSRVTFFTLLTPKFMQNFRKNNEPSLRYLKTDGHIDGWTNEAQEWLLRIPLGKPGVQYYKKYQMQRQKQRALTETLQGDVISSISRPWLSFIFSDKYNWNPHFTSAGVVHRSAQNSRKSDKYGINFQVRTLYHEKSCRR